MRDLSGKREEAVKSAVLQEFFDHYQYTQIGNIDFVIAAKEEVDLGRHQQRLLIEECSLVSYLWAEAKRGTNRDIYDSFVQLILTIGKERTFEKEIPPKFIGAFDAEKIAFIEYNKIQEVFYQNDFNWNVRPSDHDTKEFKRLRSLCESDLQENVISFSFQKDEKALKQFISDNFNMFSKNAEKIKVTKNNFTFIFQRWSEKVMPSISIKWEDAKKAGIIGADFFLADLLSSENESLKNSLYVVLKMTKYELVKGIDDLGLKETKTVEFNDKQKAHKEFWAVYERPPKEEYWDYIIERRDLLVPQDIRERKGSFFTPQIWVKKSRQYLADVLGEDWQDKYYIWDCCAGTGNLLINLTNYHKVWASTLDKADVDVMKERIKGGWPMFENHIFQFDFLNDEFSKCPEELQEILNDEEERKKLIIYINPPYAEAATTRTKTGTGTAKGEVARDNKIFEKYGKYMGGAANEIFAEFLIRVYAEIQCCKLAQFAKLKALCAPNFAKFRALFAAELKKLFVVPANTFDNVNGSFPIGFFIWDTSQKRNSPLLIEADVFERNGQFSGTKRFFEPPEKRLLMDWLKTLYDKNGERIAYLRMLGSDIQNNSGVFITISPSESDIKQRKTCDITKNNFLVLSVYFAVRLCIEATWLNDRDQFLFPNNGWQVDKEFQGDCLIYTLFHGQNRISAAQGTNHWIPFTEQQAGCKKAFKSIFMSEFLKKFNETAPLSKEAQNVYNAGLELWKYYHSQSRTNPDASFYDIRKHFQGENKGRMKSSSDDDGYNELIFDLRNKMRLLAKKIEPKVYEYGFLK